MRILSMITALCLCASAAGAATGVGTASLGVQDEAVAPYGDYLSARFAADHHDLTEAAKYYVSCLDQDPTDQRLLMLAFLYSASAGDVDQAAKLAQRVVAIAPDDFAARLTLAVAALKRHDFKDARTQIAKPATGPLTSFVVVPIDAWAAAGEGEADAALAGLKRLHAQHSADGMAFFNEAMMAEMLGDKDAAASFYKSSLDAAGMMPRLVDAYGRFLERSGRAEEAKALYLKLGSGDTFGAVAGPGLARIAKGEKPDPLVMRPEEGAAEALFGIAASLNDESLRDMSILYLRLALYLQPKLDLATMLLANRFELLEKYDDAIAAYQGIGADSPYYKLAAVKIAMNDTRLSRNDQAVASLEALSAKYPGDVDVWTALGDGYREAKKYGEATKAYDSAIEAAKPLSKSNWPLYYARAVAEQEANNWPSAEADLKQALALNPDQPQVLNYLGYSWVDKRRNITQALAMLEKARALAPEDGYIIDSVGWAYFRLGRYEDAAKTLENAVELVPGDPTINDHLGDAYWKIGRRLDARFQWSHALAFGADPDEKAKIEKKLQNGLKRDDRS